MRVGRADWLRLHCWSLLDGRCIFGARRSLEQTGQHQLVEPLNIITRTTSRDSQALESTQSRVHHIQHYSNRLKKRRRESLWTGGLTLTKDGMGKLPGAGGPLSGELTSAVLPFVRAPLPECSTQLFAMFKFSHRALSQRRTVPPGTGGVAHTICQGSLLTIYHLTQAYPHVRPFPRLLQSQTKHQPLLHDLFCLMPASSDTLLD